MFIKLKNLRKEWLTTNAKNVRDRKKVQVNKKSPEREIERKRLFKKTYEERKVLIKKRWNRRLP